MVEIHEAALRCSTYINDENADHSQDIEFVYPHWRAQFSPLAEAGWALLLVILIRLGLCYRNFLNIYHVQKKWHFSSAHLASLFAWHYH